MATSTITTQAALDAAILEARTVARSEATKCYGEQGDRGACGFAWVKIFSHKGKKIDGRTKLGKMLERAGCGKTYGGGF
ncbi:MAG: hypothetical protein LC650_02295, partial [Actinobacteria bacterium]|nr:hypothetical protein [Actinomycetota bacterium]